MLLAQQPKLRLMNFAFTTYEPGMVPGPGFTATQTVLWFVITPLVLFAVISALAFASGGKREKRKSVVDVID